ncbi:MAG TPA: DUF1345 domain-containing protein [Steroidobacteraceae bacterium]|nr:DUF1345 domain-containing protein [Steroidobacteraceae bacterium]
MRHAILQHTKLLIATAAGVVLFFVLPAAWTAMARLLVSWNAGAVLFMGWIFLRMRGLSAEQLHAKYKEEDPTAGVILVTVICAALLSLAAIVVLLSTVRQVAGIVRAEHVMLAALTVADSWLLVPTIFTLHYADAFYSATDADRPLLFPQTQRPLFWDFAYFSFTIAAACQTADVSTLTTSMRKTVLTHSLVAFVFNASILGFAVNISAGLFSG